MVNPSSQVQPVSPWCQVPTLESGDRLDRFEFERRYNAMPHLRKAELIEGVVYVPAALRFRSHARPHGQLVTWLGTYEASTKGTELGIEPTVQLDLDNEPQPDAALLIVAGGQAQLGNDDYIKGAPELVAEIAASSAAIDLGDKKRAYRRNGVKEYIVWQVFEQKIDWFSLQDGNYTSLTADEGGVVRSQVFPGLWLNISAMLAGEMQEVLSVLQQGLHSEKHHLFVQQLQSMQNQ